MREEGSREKGQGDGSGVGVGVGVGGVWCTLTPLQQLGPRGSAAPEAREERTRQLIRVIHYSRGNYRGRFQEAHRSCQGLPGYKRQRTRGRKMRKREKIKIKMRVCICIKITDQQKTVNTMARIKEEEEADDIEEE